MNTQDMFVISKSIIVAHDPFQPLENTTIPHRNLFKVPNRTPDVLPGGLLPSGKSS